MVPTDTEADLAIDLEAAGGGQEAEVWGFERVGGGEDNAAVVDAVCVGGRRGGTAQGKVPFEEVVFLRRGVQVTGGVGLEFGGFFDWAGVSA